MGQSVAIVGSGVAGLLAAESFWRRGWQVHLYESTSSHTETSKACSYVAAAMLAPYCELEKSEPQVAEWGLLSLPLWKELLQQWCPQAGCPRFGTLAVAFSREQGELQRLKQSIDKFDPKASVWMQSEALRHLEPELTKINHSLWIPSEGYLDGAQFLTALAKGLAEKGVAFHYGCEVAKIYPHQIEIASGFKSFDWVIDCRGLAAKKDLTTLRAVRGEIIRVYAPEVNFKHTIRLMHPRFPIYIVPRENHNYLIGATTLESSSDQPITVLSTLELLSSAYSLHSGFSEANILSTMVGLRPAYPDNIPRLTAEKGLIRINGLYRHGFLTSPILAKTVADYCENKIQCITEITFG